MQKALFARAGTDVATAGYGYPAVFRKTIFCSRKILLMTKLVILLCTVTIIQAHANGQNISLSFKNAALEKVLSAIEQQSGYHFIYTREEIAGTKPVNIEIKNASLETALETCFRQQPVTYTIQESYIILKQKEENKTRISDGMIIGKIVDEAGLPIAGATIIIKGSKIATASDNEGMFQLSYTGNYSQFIISSIGYVTKEITITGRNYFSITLTTAVN